MDARQGNLGEVPVRLARVSFSGELGFEISVPWAYGASLWQQLLELGAPEELIPFGIESLMVMRIEKGFLHVGSDTDGATMPQDVGFARVMANRSEEHTSELKSLMRISYAVFCLKKKNPHHTQHAAMHTIQP